jgi:hypothetical protein
MNLHISLQARERIGCSHPTGEQSDKDSIENSYGVVTPNISTTEQAHVRTLAKFDVGAKVSREVLEVKNYGDFETSCFQAAFS